MNIVISNTDGRPIYVQICEQLKSCIISGGLAPGEALPSIRTLAKDLRISVITTKRAYEELEKEGYIYTQSAKGCYVAEKNTELIREANLRRIEEHMRQISILAALCGLSEGEIAEMYTLIGKEEKR